MYKNYRWCKHILSLLLITFVCCNAFSQTPASITIVGTVLDSAGAKIEGASIVAELAKPKATTSDANGRFVIDVPVNTRIVVTYVGFQERSFVATASSAKITIVLLATEKKEEEIVVLAYGKKQRKEAVVGSVTSVQPGELKIPVSNLTNALAGQVAGVVAYQRSGQPGQDNATFFIRGVTTFGYKQDPLILIDNVELTSTDLARLQVDDIASFSILKDASATALYGARGANGVILVATKEGKAGKAKVNLRLENSISEANKSIKVTDPVTYMDLYNEATVTRNPLAKRPFSPNDIINTEKVMNGDPDVNPYVYPAVDWLGLLFKKRTNTQRANMSISGGGGVARYYVAGSYNLDHGILQEDSRNNNESNVKFQNYQIRSNVNISLTPSTELIVRLAGNFNEYKGPLAADGGFSTDLYNYAVHTSPVLFPAFYEPDSANLKVKHILFGNRGPADGSDGTGSNNVGYYNPYASMLRGYKRSSESRMSAQLELNQNLKFLTEGLTFRGIFSTNRYSYFDFQMAYSPFYYNIASYDKATDQYTLRWLNPQPASNNVPNAATEYLSYYPGTPSLNTFVYMQGVLDYNRRFDLHSVSATLIGTRQQTLYSNAKDPVTGYPSLLSTLPYRNLGVSGRLSYSFDNRYFVEGNFGYNGSERFSEDHRFGFFPTIGVSWMLSNEKFFQYFPDWLNRLKLRGSFGLVGNDAIGSQRFFYQSDVNLNGGGNYASFGTSGYTRQGVYINSYSNPDITWETSRQTNLGLEFTIFENLNVIAEVYKQHRYDILQGRSSVPSSMGLEAVDLTGSGRAPISANIGTSDSKGLDLEMNYQTRIGKDVSVAARGNLTVTSNKYGHYEEPNYPEAYRYRSGQPINTAFGFIAERLFVDDKEARNSPVQQFSTNGKLPKGGDIKYRDLNSDGVINWDDRTYIGLPTTPEVVYGFGFSGTYKQWDLSAFFQGVARTSLFIDPERVSPFIPSPDPYIGGNTQVVKEFAESHWSEENQDIFAMYPRMGVTRDVIENNMVTSTWWLRDGSFMRLKSLELGYTLPSGIAKRYYLTNCRFYFSGLNLLTWSHFKMWDPELGGNGFAYPIQRVFNFGLNVNL